MKIQRFEGENTREALAKVQQALGEDAVILQTRSIRTPGVLRRQRVEVLAAIEAGASGSAPPPLMRPAHAAPHSWQGEFDSLRRELELIRGEISQALGHCSPSSPSTINVDALVERLRQELLTGSIQLKKGAPTTVCLVGPTGSGKTTTLAKLAAAASRDERKRVALITIDTYRIGALEQLEAYARLLEVPVSRVYAPEDIRSALERYASYDLIFVDTIGRSAFNTQQISEQAALLEALGTDEVHLCLDAGDSPATLRRALDGFSLLRPTHLLLTKIDETASRGATLEVALQSGLPLSYMTTGQRVPEDLTLASVDELTERLLLGEI